MVYGTGCFHRMMLALATQCTALDTVCVSVCVSVCVYYLFVFDCEGRFRTSPVFFGPGLFVLCCFFCEFFSFCVFLALFFFLYFFLFFTFVYFFLSFCFLGNTKKDVQIGQ